MKNRKKECLTLLLVISGLVKSFAEVFIDNPGDLSNVMSVENNVPRQVLGRPVQLVLSVTFPDICSRYIFHNLYFPRSPLLLTGGPRCEGGPGVGGAAGPRRGLAAGRHGEWLRVSGGLEPGREAGEDVVTGGVSLDLVHLQHGEREAVCKHKR